MRSTTIAGLLSILLAACQHAPAAPEETPGNRVLLIRDVTIVSPERGAPLGPVDVLVRDGLIARIAGAIRAPGDAVQIDGRGKFLIPGLIDGRVHIGAPVGLNDAAIDREPTLLSDYRDQIPRSYLAFGFTTVVDLDLAAATQAWFEASPLRPRLYHCGRAARTAGGYGAWRPQANADEASLPNLIYEPNSAGSWPAGLDPDDWSAARAVDRIVERGGICVKAFIEGGFGGAFNWPTPSEATLRALREETRRRGLAFIIHANAVDAWRAALVADADIIAHGLWYWPGAGMTSAAATPETEAVIRDAARSGAAVQPTLQALYGQRSIFDPAILGDPRFSEAMPPSVVTYLRSDAGVAARRAIAREYEAAAPNILEISSVFESRVEATLSIMSQSGVRLLFGSDTPSGDGFGNPPGLNGRLELQRWADAGVPLARILSAATIDNARAFGLDGELGTVETGKRADLLLLEDNPLVDANAYDSITYVIVDGRVSSRTALIATRVQ